MNRFLTVLILTLAMASPVQAERSSSIFGYAKGLIFNSETTLTSDSGFRALCTVVNDLNVLFVPIQREVEGYVLADSTCTGQSIAGITPETMARLVSVGVIVDTVPLTPSLTAGWMLWNYAGIIFGVLAILYGGLSLARRKHVADIDAPTTTHRTPMFDETLLTTMFHTARLNGDISQVTLQGLIKSYKTLTGTTVTPAMITAKYALKTDTADLLSIMHQFVGLERDTMMKACMDVAAADGIIQKPEHDFLMALGSALGLDGDMFRIQIHEAMKPSRLKMSNKGFAPA